MIFIKVLTFIENHLYVVLGFLLGIVLSLRFFWKESQRLSYRQQRELEQFLQGFHKAGSDFEEQRPPQQGIHKTEGKYEFRGQGEK